MKRTFGFYHQHLLPGSTLFILFFFLLALFFDLRNTSATEQIIVEEMYDRDSGGQSGSSLRCIQNVGQFPQEIKYFLWGPKQTMWITADGIWLTFEEYSDLPFCEADADSARSIVFVPGTPESIMKGFSDKDQKKQNVRVVTRMRKIKLDLGELRRFSEPEPFDRIETDVHYYRQRDPAAWQISVPVWGGLRWREIFPGLDLELISDNNNLLLQFCANGPLSAVSDVRLRISGTSSIRTDGLQVYGQTHNGEQLLPLSFRLKNTTSKGCVYHELEPVHWGTTIAFRTGPEISERHSPTKTNDDFLYSTFYGGTDTDVIEAIAKGDDGSIYTAGWTKSMTVYGDMIPGSVEIRSSEVLTQFTGPIFVTRFTSDLGNLIYAAFISGEFQGPGSQITEWGRDVVVDESGNAYFTGETVSFDNFPVTPGAYDTSLNDGVNDTCPEGLTSKPCPDAFFVKLDPMGQILYSTYLGGSQKLLPPHNDDFGGNDHGQSIGVHSSGLVYLVGSTNSDDFPTTIGAYDRIFSNKPDQQNTDVFLVTINPAGQGQNDLQYSTYIGSGYSNYGFALDLDDTGLAYVTGSTWGSFPTTLGAYDSSFNGVLPPNPGQCFGIPCPDVFLFIMNPAGNGLSDLIYSTYFGDGAYGSPNYEAGLAIDVNHDGSKIVIGGYTNAPSFPVTADACQSTLPKPDKEVGFVAVFNPYAMGSNNLKYSTYLGGTGLYSDDVYGVLLDGDSFSVTGRTDSADFPVTPDAYDQTLDGTWDAFFCRFSPTAQRTIELVYSTLYGGYLTDIGHDMALAEAGAVYLAGATYSSDFPVTNGAYDTSFNGYEDGFAAKIRYDDTAVPVLSLVGLIALIIALSAILLFGKIGQTETRRNSR